MCAVVVWIIVFKSTSFLINGAVILACCLIISNPTRLLSGFILGASSSISMFMIWHNRGTTYLWWRITSEGLTLAAQLSLRYMAMIMVVLAASSFISLEDFLKCLGRLPYGGPIAYIAGVSIQWIPQVAHLMSTIKDTNTIMGRSIKGPIKYTRFVLIPLISRMFYMSALRGIPLEISGITLRCKKTILNPVADSTTQKIIRIILVGMSIFILIAYGN